MNQLRNNLINGFDLYDHDQIPYDFGGILYPHTIFPIVDYHGTQVAHLLTMDTEKILVNVGKFSKVSLLSIPTLISKQIAEGVKIINMSFNYSRILQIPALIIGLKNVIKMNPQVLFVVSAGNDGVEKKTFLGSFDFENIINVAASDNRNQLWEHSTYGETVDFAAPGIHSLVVPGNEDIEDVVSGTSFSAPFVSRIAAKMLYENQRLTPKEIKHILCQTIDKVQGMKGKMSCPGIVNELRALEIAKRSFSK